MTVLAAHGEGGVREAPRHEVAELGHGGAAHYGVLRKTPVFVWSALAEETHATSAIEVRFRLFAAVVMPV